MMQTGARRLIAVSIESMCVDSAGLPRNAARFAAACHARRRGTPAKCATPHASTHRHALTRAAEKRLMARGARALKPSPVYAEMEMRMKNVQPNLRIRLGTLATRGSDPDSRGRRRGVVEGAPRDAV